MVRAGTNIHPNQWTIRSEAALYRTRSPSTLKRWLVPSWPTYQEPLSVYPNLQNFSAFGFSLNIGVARIAWCCEIKRKDGRLAGEHEYTTEWQPKNFAEGSI